MELSASRRGRKNPYLLQEEKEKVVEEANDAAAVDSESNEVYDINNDMVVTIE